MEAHKLRFVRCPKCHQLLVEYPSIPVYKCGGCATVLRAKNRAVPAAQASSESDDRNNFPSSLKGFPQNDKSFCSDEKKIASSVDQPRETAADGTVSSNTNSCETAIQETSMSVAESVTSAEHRGDETHSLIDENTKNPGVTVKEIHDKDTGANPGSNLTENLENLDTRGNANKGKVDNFGTSKVSTLYEKTEAVQRKERIQTYEGMNVESHEALIEELERSLSFSSEDEEFSDEAENSGLSDALRHQLGSRRFMLGGKMNNASRSDPHGRLIEELEMSFSDAEEPMEHHHVVAHRIHGSEYNKYPQTLGVESAHPCEDSICSVDNGHLECEQTFHQENMLIDNGNQGKEDSEDGNNTANYVNGNEHIVVADEDTAERFHEKEHDKDWQSVDMESAHPCEDSICSVDNGHLECDQTFHQENMLMDNGNQGKEDSEDGNNTANYVHGNEHIVVADEDTAERFHEKEHIEDLQSADMESAHPCKGSISSIDDGSITFKQKFQPNDLTEDGTQEKEQGSMEDDNMANIIHGNENPVFSDEDIAERVDGNEEPTADHSGENEESCMSNCDHRNEDVAAADEHIGKPVDNNEDESMEAEGVHLYEGAISSFSAVHIKSEQSFQQNELIADGTKKKEEDDIQDSNTTNCAIEDSAAVASFSTLSNKKDQYMLSFNKNKEEMPYRYRSSQLRQGLSLDAEDFKSIQNFIESQMDDTSSSLSSGSPCLGDLVHKTSNTFNNIVRHERLKKMGELRDQLSRLSSQTVLEKRCQKIGPEYQQRSNSYDVGRHLQSVDANSIPSSCALESYYGHGRPPRYQPPNPFSPTHTYPHCHFGHAQARIPHNYDLWEFNSYYQSSYAESSILDHDSLMSSYKEQKRVVRKHILRPLSGASPFSICNSCFNLVQMPSDMYISKAKIGKMQCGQCSKVLVLSFAAAHHAEGKISKDAALQSKKPDGSIIAKNEDATSHSAECLQGPFSINEEYGASFTRSFSTQAGSSRVATQSGKKASDSALHRLMGYDSASQLLRHSRVFDSGYESFESMVPDSSRVSKRKNI